MKPRFVFFYFLKNKPEKVQKTIVDHINYWTQKEDLKEYAGGPFGDRSGGMITFRCDSLEEATSLIMNDPFIKNNLIEKKYIKEWVVEDEISEEDEQLQKFNL